MSRPMRQPRTDLTITRMAEWLWIAIKTIVLLALLFFSITPIIWLVATSFKRQADFFAYPPVILFAPTLTNFQSAVFGSPAFFDALWHSFFLATCVTAMAIGIGSLAGYALARYRFRGARAIGVAILASRLIPGATMVIPYFALMRQLHLTGTMLGLILTYSSFALGFCSWMMYGFFLELPRDLEEAALVDGATPYGAFWRVALPLALPGVIATGILAFIGSWNEFLYALIIGGRNTRTLPVELAGNITERSVNWGDLFAIATAMVVPVFILTLLVQRNLVRGLTAGAVKG